MATQKEFKGNYSFNEILRSFNYWPSIFKILWETNKVSVILISFFYLLLGLTPTLNIHLTEKLFNALATEKTMEGIIIPLILFVTVLIVSNISRIIQSMVNNLFTIEVTNKINKDILEKATQLRLEDFENPEIQDQFKRALQESSHAPISTFQLISTFLTNVITFGSLFVLIFITLKWYSLFLLMLPIFHFVPNLKLTQYEYNIYWNRAPKQRIMWYIQYLISNYRSFKELKLNNAGNHFVKEFSSILDFFFIQDKKIQKKRLFIYLIIDFLSLTIIVGLLIYVVQLTVNQTILVGTSVALVQGIVMSTNKLSEISSTMISFCQNNIYLDQFFRFINYSNKLTEMNDDKEYKELNHIYSVEFKNVYFKYPGNNEYSLKGVNFQIQSGDILAIVGQNGSGKSTIIKLIAGLYEIDRGEILINNINIKNLSKDDLRKKISIMHQDFETFELTLRKNIAITNLEHINNDAALMRCINHAGLDNIFFHNNKGLDTQLGKWFNNGVQLSGGEWQRVTYARTMFKNADINILDEPTSALDPFSEEDILSNFAKNNAMKIGIFITHRYSNIKYANKILVINNGKVIESGNHEKLINMKGYYYELFKKQTGIKEVEKV
ncbi:MAG TPA: ABC transporter ATP-binding protein [Cerasibacillus sp.]|uniref:ABC transporter ATP-binding protein n=1 Tax=Cerasibacillus sp. TaxID=2498711 RepID=UPI002F42C134